MCTYCFIADWMREYSPWKPVNPYPVNPSPWPLPPAQPWPTPIQPWPTPIQPWPVNPSPLPNPVPDVTWTRKQLDEALEILRKVKEMEDALGGCPCEDVSKLDFLKEIRERLDALEAAQKGSSNDESTEKPASDNHPISD